MSDQIVATTLHSKKDDIETAFGEPLEWQRLDNRWACRIRKSFALGAWKEPEKWDTAATEMVDALVRLEKALEPHIQKLVIETA